MSDVTLAITQPQHGAVLNGAVTLAGTASGNTAGLSFKWFSSLSTTGTEAHPELNQADHSIAALTVAAPLLAAFGSHAVVLAATDQDGIDSASVKAIRRAALAGGAPPAAPAPCVVHQLWGASFLTPASNGLTLSIGGATIDVLAPGGWAKPDPANPGGDWVANVDGQLLNGITMVLRIEPDGAADPAHSADIALTTRPAPLLPLPIVRASDKTWLRVAGALPANLNTGAYRLLLQASAGNPATMVSVTRLVTLTA